jgi:hypothetical protein
MVSITSKRGLHVYFQKRASGFNMCVGEHIRGKKYSNRAEVRNAFKGAVQACK